jgi:hypothetical protein
MYPNNPYSKILLDRLGDEGYEQWAQEMRDSVEEKEQIVIQNIQEDRKYEAVLRTTEKAIEKIYSLEQRIDALTTAVLSITAARGNSALAPQDDAINITPVNLNASVFQLTLDATPVPPQARDPITISPTPNQNPNATMPSTPIIPVNAHKTIKLNIEFWITKCYWKYMDRTNVSLQALSWDAATQHCFRKRRDIAVWVKKVAEKGLCMTLDWTTDSLQT